jgi:MFS family permease
MSALRSPLVRRFALVELLLQTQFWFPVWFLFLRDLGFGIGVIVLADALFRCVVVACEVPLGVVTDRLGRRRSYVALALLSGVTFLAITQVRNTPLLLAVWVLWGVQWAATSGLGAAYLTEAVRTHAPEVGLLPAFGAVRAAAGVTGCLSLASAGFLYGVDPRLPFLVTAGCALAAVPLILGLPRLAAPRRTAGRRPWLGEVRQVSADLRLRLLLASGVLVLFYGWSVTFLFQPLVLEEGMGEQAAAWMYAGFAAAGLAGGLVAPALDRFLGLRGIALAFAGIVLAVLGAALGSGVVAVLFVPLLGLGYYTALTLAEAAISHQARTASRATALSLVSAVAGLGIAVARPSLGLAGDRWGTAAALAGWSALGALLLVVLLATLRRVGQHVPRT